MWKPYSLEVSQTINDKVKTIGPSCTFCLSTDILIATEFIEDGFKSILSGWLKDLSHLNLIKPVRKVKHVHYLKCLVSLTVAKMVMVYKNVN